MWRTTGMMKYLVIAIIFASVPAMACSPQPWADNPCRRADLPSCYYDWMSNDGQQLGTCTSVLSRCEGEFSAILDMCNKKGCSRDLIIYANKNLTMTAHALNTVCAHTGRE